MERLRTKTVLLVEDEAIIALTGKMSLEKYGYSVIVANSGEKAVEVFRAHDAIELILMDIDLGAGIDGTLAAALILAYRDVPVVFMSSHTEPEIVEKTEKITSYGYVVKNSSMTVIDASIKMAFKLFEANRKIAQSEKKQNALISNIADVISILSLDGRIIYKSPNVEKWFGWKPQDHMGRDPWGVVHPDDVSYVSNVLLLVSAQTNMTKTLEFRYLCRDGSYKPVEMTATNLSSNPIIDGILLNYHDISERRRTEETLAEVETRFKALFEKGPIGVAYHEMICDSAGNPVDYRFLEANESYIALTGVDPRGKKVTEAFPGIENDPFDWIGKFGHVAMTGEEFRVEQYLQQNDRWYDCVGYQFKPGHFVAAFVEITARKKAELSLQVKNEEYEVLNEELRSSMEELQSVNEALLSKQDAIQDSEAKFRLLYTAMDQGLALNEIIYDDGGKPCDSVFIELNESYLRFLGVIRGQAIGKRMRAVMRDGPPEWLAVFGSVVSTGEPASFEYYQEASGKHFLIHSYRTRKNQFAVLVSDITERKKAEGEMIRLKGLLNSIVESAPVAIFAKDTRGAYRIINNAGAKIMGYRVEEVIGRSDFDLLPAETAREFRKTDDEVVSSGCMFEREESGIVGGRPLVFSAHKVPWKDDEGKIIGVIGVSSDITERKQFEKNLLASEEKFRNLVWDLQIGVLLQGPKAEMLLSNPKALELLGLSEDQLLGKTSFDPYWNVIHEDGSDFPSPTHPVPLAISTGKAVRNVVMGVFRPGKNDRIWLSVDAEPQLNPDGSVYEVVCSFIDISKRKIAEREVRQNELRLKRLVDVLQHPSETIQEFLDFALEQAILLTESKIGYIYYYSEEKQEFILNSWSKDVMAECTVLNPATTYDLSKTGIWGEAVRQRKAIIVNDYAAANPMKKGLPHGHVPLKNFMTVPVFKGDSIVGVIGLSNKDGDYDDSDLLQVSLLMDVVWKVTDRKIADEKVRQLLAEKEIILKEVHHRIKNNMNSIYALLSMQAGMLEDSSASTALEDAGRRVQSMMVLYNKLYQAPDVTVLSVDTYLSDLIEGIVLNLPRGKNIAVEKKIEDFILDAKRLQPLGIIINELLTNVMKYAFNGRSGGTITVSAAARDNLVTIAVADDGNGMPDSLDIGHSTGFGLVLVGELTKQLQGTIRLERGNGSRFVLEFDR
jgi:PAS domain S-box-containing protein